MFKRQLLLAAMMGAAIYSATLSPDTWAQSRRVKDSAAEVVEQAQPPLFSPRFPGVQLRTYSFTFNQLGILNPFQLRGVDPIYSIPFSIPADEVVTSLKLKLDFSYSPSLLTQLSHLKIMLNGEVAQTVALISTLSEREQDQDVVTLSTLHAAKGLEWPHVILAGVNEGLLPFKPDADGDPEALAARIEEVRRLMYVGITRAQRTLVVSWLKQRKQGRERVPAQASRFIAEMQLDPATTQEDPRAKLRALREEFAARAAGRAPAR